MRCLILALMIVLLPLRSGIGDAMATEMAAGQFQPQIAIINLANDVDETGAAAHFHHETIPADGGMSIAHADVHQAHPCGEGAPQPAQQHGNSTNCDACSLCQVCHTVALFNAPATSPGTVSPAFHPEAMRHHYASADAALSEKPPIS